MTNLYAVHIGEQYHDESRPLALFTSKDEADRFKRAWLDAPGGREWVDVDRVPVDPPEETWEGLWI